MTATTFQRLLKYPHGAVFDKSPNAQLALRVRHENGSKWRVADGVLSVAVGDVTWEYDLSQHTIGSLADALEADGFDVIVVSSGEMHRSAMALIEGEGDQYQSNGDHLYTYASLLWAILGSYGVEMRYAKEQVQEALKQMVITTAEGEWLDLWGLLYGVGRNEGEPDSEFQLRIPEEAFRLRVNRLAIQKAIKDITGKDVEIREPWRSMFRLDESALSGSDRFPDESYYGYFVIHPVAHEAIDWTDVLEVIHRNRPAGVQVYSPHVEFPVWHVETQPPAEYTASLGIESVYSTRSLNPTDLPLGLMRLDDHEFTYNHPVVVFHTLLLSNATGLEMGVDVDKLNIDFTLNVSRLAYVPTKIVGVRHIPYASICLSDGVPLGDENAIFPRGLQTYHTDPPETLSDELAPSEYEVIVTHHRVERIMLDEHVYEIDFDDPARGGSLAIHEESI